MKMIVDALDLPAGEAVAVGVHASILIKMPVRAAEQFSRKRTC